MGSTEVSWDPQEGAEIHLQQPNGKPANHSERNGHCVSPGQEASPYSSKHQNGSSYRSLSLDELHDDTGHTYSPRAGHKYLALPHSRTNGYTSMEEIGLTDLACAPPPPVQQNGGPGHEKEKEAELDQADVVRAPKDKWMLAFMIFALHGVATLMPWNCFITAEPYFTDYKFGNLSDDVEYKDKFVSYLGVGGFLPNIVFLAVALFFPPKSSTVMTFIGLMIMMLLFVLTTVLAVIDTSDCPGAFFAITMTTIVIFNGAGAVYQSGMFALTAKLPGMYTQIYIVGQGLGGTVVALLYIFSTTATDDILIAAVAYFLSAAVVLVLACISYVYLFHLPVVKFYLRAATQFITPEDPDEHHHHHHHNKPPLLWTLWTLWRIFKEIKLQIFNIWLTFTVSLTIFPAMMIDVVPIHEPNWFWGSYFTPVTCFLLFNLLDFFGSIIPAWIKWPSKGRTWILVVCRVVLIPLVMFCNYRPDNRSLPVLFYNDYVYIVIVSVMSITNGYLKTIIMIDAPQHLSNPEWTSKAAAMMVLFLVFGIFSGLQFSVVVAFLV